MINKYFDFERMWKEEVKKSLDDLEIDDPNFNVKLDGLTVSEAAVYLKDMPFPINLNECEIDFDFEQILFDFSETANEPTESDSYQGFFRVYVTWSIRDEYIASIGYEHG